MPRTTRASARAAAEAAAAEDNTTEDNADGDTSPTTTTIPSIFPPKPNKDLDEIKGFFEMAAGTHAGLTETEQKQFRKSIVWNYLENGVVFPNGEGGYIEGIPLSMFANAFPGYMAPIIELLNRPEIKQLFEKNYYAQVFIAAFFEGDGVESVSLTHDDRRPKVGINIGGDKPFHNLLTRKFGYNSNNPTNVNMSTAAVATLNKELFEQHPTMWHGFYAATALKKLQWITTSALGNEGGLVDSRRGVRTIPPHELLARRSLNHIISALNNLHGEGISIDQFENWFEFMRCVETNILEEEGGAPITFLIFLAGIMSSDGGVGYGDWGTECYIYQSCENWCKALAKVIERAFGFEIGSVKVSQRNEAVFSPNTREGWKITFNKQQTDQILLAVGAFDYNRRSQWLVLLVLRLVSLETEESMPTRELVRSFLDDLLSTIREEMPSDEWEKGLWHTVDPIADTAASNSAAAAGNNALNSFLAANP